MTLKQKFDKISELLCELEIKGVLIVGTCKGPCLHSYSGSGDPRDVAAALASGAAGLAVVFRMYAESLKLDPIQKMALTVMIDEMTHKLADKRSSEDYARSIIVERERGWPSIKFTFRT